MRKRIFSLLILSLLLVAFTAMATYGSEKPVERRVINQLVNSTLQYAFPDTRIQPIPWSGDESSMMDLGRAGMTNPFPGVGDSLGDTWYDYQRNGSMRRMITWGKHGTPDTMLVHFSWMRMPTSAFSARKSYYKVWNAAGGSYSCEKGIQPDDEYAGYNVIARMNNNSAIVSAHNNLTPPNGPYATQAYKSNFGGSCNFAVSVRVPDGVGDACKVLAGNDASVWPAVAWQEGADTVLHILAQESSAGAGDPQALIYFRAQNPFLTATWTTRCLDTVYTLAQDVDCNNNGKVALAWTANLRDTLNPTCDTCSSYEQVQYVQLDNDVYYQISLNGGVTWQPRVNLTKHTDSCRTGTAEARPYRPYVDVSVLVDSKNDMHVVWSARYWPGDATCGGQAGLYRGRIFHWSEDQPYIRTVHNAEWDQTTCSPGAWNLNACKQTVSECDGKLYVLFVQVNDIPAGIEDDCAYETNPGFPTGAANGELYVTVSSDYGLTWDAARNLTNSRTINSNGQYCDSVGGTYGPCPSENWPSMARFGTSYTGQFPSNIVVPTGGSDPSIYLDVQYIDDPSAGGIVQNEGYWQNASVRWFRLACVEPVPNPQFSLAPPKIVYPCWTKHGVQKDVAVDVENSGNATLTYTYTEVEDTGPTGWLSTSNFDGSVPAGLNNIETGTVHINTGGIENNPGTIVYLSGRLVFNSNAPTTPDTLPIECWVVDTLIPPIWDTVSTTCTKLTVANTGNFGNQGKGKVNLDYVDSGDCDTTAEVYLYDGSPVVGYPKAGDTLVNFSIFNTTYIDDEGFVPYGDHTPTTDMGEYEVFESGKFVTHDSSLVIEKIWYAPKAPVDSCSFVIECIKVYVNYPYVDETVTGVRIGEAIDWDIPSDSGSDNGSYFDATRNLIYQQGAEYNQDDTTECIDNDRRFGGIDFLESYKNGSLYKSAQHGAYTADNATYIYPNSGFVTTELYSKMDTSGYRFYSSLNPDSEFVDLHTVMTFDTGLTVTVADTFVYYISIVSHYGLTADLASFLAEVDEQIQWYEDHVKPEPQGCCKGTRGNVDGDVLDQVNVGDLTYLVDYLFRGGPAPPCQEEGNVDGDVLEQVNVGDLTYLVDYLFRGGPPPPACP